MLITGAGLSRSLNYLVASESALNDAGKSAAIGDFLQRLAKAQQWVNTHIDEYAPVYAKNNGVSVPVAVKVLKEVPIVYVPITEPIKSAQQSEADIFLQQGILKTKLDTSSEFDTRFNDLVAAATGSAGPAS